MDRLGKGNQQKVTCRLECDQHSHENKCTICKKHFKSRSHFDAICDLCWADHEMRPYLAPGGLRGVGFIN